MVDVLLAHAFFLKNDPKQVEKMRPYAPLGTLYAAAILRRAGSTVALFDAMLAAGDHEFALALAEHRPRVVAIYEDSFNFLNKMCLEHARAAACRMIGLARAAGATVLAAGADPTDRPEVYLGSGAHACLLGEADETLLEVVDVLAGRGNGPIEAVAGLALPDPASPGGVRRTAPRAPERQPDRFPFPAWDLLDVEPYRAAWRAAHGFFSVNMVTTRGCPFHCNWCAKPIWGQRYAMRSPANVAAELALVKATVRPDHVWFADDIFGLRPRWVADFAREVAGARCRDPVHDPVARRPDDRRGGGRARRRRLRRGLARRRERQPEDPRRHGQGDRGRRDRRRARRGSAPPASGPASSSSSATPARPWRTSSPPSPLVREHLPDDIGVCVSYPLPGTRFHEMVAAELGDKTHWDDSNDLAMMFQGTYQTPFYRKLRLVVHRDLETRRRLAAAAPPHPELLAELALLEADWRELERLEVECRSEAPTAIHKPYGALPPPDLSRAWN